MNKILSILAICAIFGVASAALTDTHVLLTADEVASNFTGSVFVARCPKDTQVAIFSISGKKDDTTTLNITRRIADSTTFEKSKDIADVNFLKTFAGNKRGYGFASSQDGYFAIASTNGSFVSVTIFQADANLTDDKSFKVADAVLNATGSNLTIVDVYFQDNYFYVVAVATGADEKMTAAYIQGVQAKDAKTLATSKGQVKLTADGLSKTAAILKCSTVPGSGKPAVCTYNYDGKGAVFSRNVTFNDNTATAEATIVTLADNDGLMNLITFPTKEGVVSIVASNSATSASYNGAAAVQIGNQIYGSPVTAAYYYDQYFVVSSGANNATPPVSSLYYTTFNTTGVAAGANLTNVTIDAITYEGQFIRPDQAFYIVYTKGTDKAVSIGKLFDKISDKKSATILKSAIASIFVAAAMLFAF